MKHELNIKKRILPISIVTVLGIGIFSVGIQSNQYRDETLHYKQQSQEDNSKIRKDLDSLKKDMKENEHVIDELSNALKTTQNAIQENNAKMQKQIDELKK